MYEEIFNPLQAEQTSAPNLEKTCSGWFVEYGAPPVVGWFSQTGIKVEGAAKPIKRSRFVLKQSHWNQADKETSDTKQERFQRYQARRSEKPSQWADTQRQKVRLDLVVGMGRQNEWKIECRSYPMSPEVIAKWYQRMMREWIHELGHLCVHGGPDERK